MASSFQGSGPPPPGVTPNFVDPPDTLDSTITALVITFTIITTALVTARLVGRWSIGSFRIDDYFCMASWVVYVAWAILFEEQARAGIGRHIWDVPISWSTRIAQISWALELLNCLGLYFARTAILYQIQIIFCPLKAGYIFLTSKALIWANAAMYLSFFVAIAVECFPTEKIWNYEYQGGFCVNRDALILFFAAFNLGEDVILLALPVWALSLLRTSWKYKLGAMVIFGMGVFVVVCSCSRVVYSVFTLRSTDSTYTVAKVGIWALAEYAALIACVCLPLIPRFVRATLASTSWQWKPFSFSRCSRTSHDKTVSESYPGCDNENSVEQSPHRHPQENKVPDEEEAMFIQQTKTVEIIRSPV